MAGGESLPGEVSKDANAISYCGLAYIHKNGIRALTIDGVSPSQKQTHDYPLTRNLYFYTVGEMKPEVSNFIHWVKTSKEARKVIEKVGFIPVQPTPVAKD